MTKRNFLVVYGVWWSSCGVDSLLSMHLGQHAAEVKAANLRNRNMRAFVRPMEVLLDEESDD
jgi:hypothetical protein